VKSMTVGIAIAMFATGCASNRDRVMKRATFDLNCPADQLDVQVLDKAWAGDELAWGVRGCGKQTTYLLAPAGQIVQNSELQPAK